MRSSFLFAPSIFLCVGYNVGPDREETASTIQLDFITASRLDLSYIGEDGKEHHPYIIHRAPLGSHERFVAILIEKYSGAFPSWLAPVQVKILTVADRHQELAGRIVQELRDVCLRAEVDESRESLPKKIRSAAAERVPYVLVIGDSEVLDGSVSVRKRGEKFTVSLSLTEFRERLLAEVRERRLTLSVI